MDMLYDLRSVIVEKTEWYFEYDIQKNRPGLLGDISFPTWDAFN